MSTYIPGPGPVTVRAPGRPVLAAWALGLSAAAPVLGGVSAVSSRVSSGTVSQLIVGLSSLLTAPAVLLGFVLGLVALSRARRDGAGRGLAVSAVVISAVQIGLVVLMAVFIMIIFALGGS